MRRKLFPSPRSSWGIYGEKTRKQIIYNQSAYVKCDYAYARQFKKIVFPRMGNKSSTASKQAPPPPTHNPGDGIRSLESSGTARTTDESERTGF